MKFRLLDRVHWALTYSVSHSYYPKTAPHDTQPERGDGSKKSPARAALGGRAKKRARAGGQESNTLMAQTGLEPHCSGIRKAKGRPETAPSPTRLISSPRRRVFETNARPLCLSGRPSRSHIAWTSVVTPLLTCDRSGGSIANAMQKIGYAGYRFPPEIIR
jgi:hypothetical protein